MSDFQEYPKAMHGPDGAEATVYSAEEEKALGKDWVSGHVYWGAIAAKREEVDGDPSPAKETSEETAKEAPVVPKKRGRKKKVVE